jgi:CheY-like chemotaxis protein
MARLLVVDDDELVCSVIGATLGEVHDVDCVLTGNAALEIIEKGTPIDVFLTDIKLPGLHGFALARIARRRLPNLKVLYISGYPEELKQYVGARLGPVLEKPVRAAELVRTIEDLLSGPWAQ